MTHFINFLINQLSLIPDFITAILAIIVLLMFNTHTKKAENVEMQHLYINQLRDITKEVNELLDKTQKAEILDVIASLKAKKYDAISSNDIEKLRVIIIKCYNVYESVMNPVFEASDYFDTTAGVVNKIDPKTSLNEQGSMLRDFIKSSVDLMDEYRKNLSKNGKDNTGAQEKIASIDALKVYLRDGEVLKVTSNKSAVSADKPSDKSSLILMVAMRGSLDDKSWSEQSLGNWRVAKDKAGKIKYILGVNVDTRNVVSLTGVKNDPNGIKKNDMTFYRFKTDSTEEVYQQNKGEVEEPINLDAATHWNPRNPIRYIDLDEQELDDIKESLKNSNEHSTEGK